MAAYLARSVVEHKSPRKIVHNTKRIARNVVASFKWKCLASLDP